MPIEEGDASKLRFHKYLKGLLELSSDKDPRNVPALFGLHGTCCKDETCDITKQAKLLDEHRQQHSHNGLLFVGKHIVSSVKKPAKCEWGESCKSNADHLFPSIFEEGRFIVVCQGHFAELKTTFTINESQLPQPPCFMCVKPEVHAKEDFRSYLVLCDYHNHYAKILREANLGERS